MCVMSVSADVSIGSRSLTSTASCVMLCADSPTCDVVSTVTELSVTHGASACQSELAVVMDLPFTPVAGQWWENLQLAFEQPPGLLNCQHASFPSSLRKSLFAFLPDGDFSVSSSGRVAYPTGLGGVSGGCTRS